jgi:putative signal transducing protein
VSGRVRIGTCANPADAALIRSVFTARGIGVVIGAEHHASLLGPIGGSFLSLDIWVASDDAEEAAALLHDLREGGPAGAEAGDTPEGADAAPPDEPDEDDGELEHERRVRIEQRRRAGLAILLGCFVTFGTAHMVTGAWARGLVLAATEVAGIRYLVLGDKLGTAIILAAVIADLTGALWRLRGPRTLPVARVRRS